jgi:hypothetical protein
LSEALDLIGVYVVAVSGALDLFDETYVTESVRAWLEDPTRIAWPSYCIIHLVLAIGAQARARDDLDDSFAEQHFIQGRDYALRHLIDDPSIFTVQAFSLITWYMLTASRRNGATMNLGFAVQAAYALGIHRHEANTSFGTEMAKTRERAWKTLRVCDLFLSSSMGRPSITSRVDANVPSPASGLDTDERLASAMTRICLIFERILSEVYARRAVSLELAASISEQHRIWTEALPEMLEADGISPEELPGPVDLSKTLGSAIVVMAYHYSIILLTRPFLTYRINSFIRKKESWPRESVLGPDITAYSDACVTSAINGIELAYKVLSYDKMPKRLPLVVNSVFISALVIGLAYFGDYHCRGWALDQTLDQAIRILRHFGLKSPQPARYQQIVEFLQEATVQYKYQRQEMTMRSHNRQVSNVFGNVSAHLDRGRISTMRRNTERQPELNHGERVLSMIDSDFESGDTASSTLGTLDTILQSSLITTSGKIAHAQLGREGLQFANTFPLDDGFEAFVDDMSANTTGEFSFMEGGPLFALMEQYSPV